MFIITRQSREFIFMVQAMEMNDKPDETDETAGEGSPGGVPLPSPAELHADLQTAQAVAAALEEEEEQVNGRFWPRVHCDAQQVC